MFCYLMSSWNQITRWHLPENITVMRITCLASWNFSAFHLQNENVPFNFPSLWLHCHRRPCCTMFVCFVWTVLLLFVFCKITSCLRHMRWAASFSLSFCWFVGMKSIASMPLQPYDFAFVFLPFSFFSPFFHWSFGHRRLCLGFAYVLSNSNDTLDNDVSYIAICRNVCINKCFEGKQQKQNTCLPQKTFPFIQIYISCMHFYRGFSHFFLSFPFSVSRSVRDFVFTERIISDFNYIFLELSLGKFPLRQLWMQWIFLISHSTWLFVRSSQTNCE